ncbi:MAG: hypothetical protein KJ880_07915 [Candidatus Omnitrophica bacterium]|nr:hypothetical protein [Candidatus Omnitrophota bacterium]MBU1869016.1 hypothetical protein [Candidatus Omnitrophota bacterium]
MKKFLTLIICSGLVIAAVGCQSNKTRVAEGSVIGGLLGATVGGIVGHQGGHGAEGAAIGAAAGVLGGALVGAQMKKPGQEQAQGATQTGQPAGVNPKQMTTQQIIDLTKQGVHEAVIIDKIRLTNSKFVLTPAEIENLKKQGVSQKVIDVMQGI